MATSRLQQLASKAKGAAQPIYSSLRSQTVQSYESLMANNKQYVVQDKDAADKLLKQWFFTQLARIPSTMQHSKQEMGMLRGRLAEFRELPVPEMAIYTVFAAELFAWFTVGEIVGRGFTLTGYDV